MNLQKIEIRRLFIPSFKLFVWSGSTFNILRSNRTDGRLVYQLITIEMEMDTDMARYLLVKEAQTISDSTSGAVEETHQQRQRAVSSDGRIIHQWH